MSVTAEEFRSLLEAHEKGQDLLEFFNTAVNAEKERGITEKRKVNAEAQGLRKYKMALEKLGFDKESAELDGYIDDLIAKVEGTSVQSTTQMTELQNALKKLQRDFERTQSELGTEKQQREELQKQNRIKTIEGKLTKPLSDEFYGANFILRSLIADGLVDLEDSTGEVIFKKGDQTMDMQAGLKWLQETNSDARRNKQNGGAGSQPSTQPAKAKYTVDQIKTMKPEEIRAHLAEVNDSIRMASAG